MRAISAISIDMTLPTEKEFMHRVEAWLNDAFGEESVEQEPYLPDHDRIPDFIVHRDYVKVVIEVENSANDCIYGYGQVKHYATLDEKYIPLLVFPAEDPDREEVDRLSHSVGIVPLPKDW